MITLLYALACHKPPPPPLDPPPPITMGAIQLADRLVLGVGLPAQMVVLEIPGEAFDLTGSSNQRVQAAGPTYTLMLRARSWSEIAAYQGTPVTNSQEGVTGFFTLEKRDLKEARFRITEEESEAQLAPPFSHLQRYGLLLTPPDGDPFRAYGTLMAVDPFVLHLTVMAHPAVPVDALHTALSAALAHASVEAGPMTIERLKAQAALRGAQ